MKEELEDMNKALNGLMLKYGHITLAKAHISLSDLIDTIIDESYKRGFNKAIDSAIQALPDKVDYKTHMGSQSKWEEGNGHNSCREQALSA